MDKLNSPKQAVIVQNEVSNMSIFRMISICFELILLPISDVCTLQPLLGLGMAYRFYKFGDL
jgi:hypothetical protein